MASRGAALVAGMVLGGAIVYGVTRLRRNNLPSTQQQQLGQEPDVSRIAGDFMNACDDLRPLMAELQRSGADGSLSPADIFAIVQAARPLTRS